MATSKARDPVDYIDPLIGTGSQGKTFPGAATPGGMVQLSPDTITGGDNGSGYRYYHKTIQGFSFTHMSGVGWYGDLGNFLVMPTTGPLKTWWGQSYRKLFDADVPWSDKGDSASTQPDWKGWFNAKDKDGNWAPWDGLRSNKITQEATVYEEGWAVPFDIPGLVALLGGKDMFIDKLSDFFDRTPDVGKWNDFYNQPNEPVQLIPFMFNRVGAPWLTQKWIRVIDAAYNTGPEGLCGDEDVGQMSAWFVLAASGLHQACPGDLRYEIFSPLFDKVTLHLDPKYAKGTAFTIAAENNSPENVYIQSAKLNGKPLNRCWLMYQEITEGGTLDLILGAQPNKDWGLAN